ncbi:MAG: transglycosylase SLT domain-containing protein [Sandaracinaceae bacterium]
MLAALVAPAAAAADDPPMCLPSMSWAPERAVLPPEAFGASDAPLSPAPQRYDAPLPFAGPTGAACWAGTWVMPPWAPFAAEGLDAEDGRSAYRRARSWAERGEIARAIVELETVAAVYPQLEDRVALWAAELRMAHDEPTARTCDAYDRAQRSPHRALAVLARVGHARCLLATGDRRGAEEVKALTRRYPSLPQRPELLLRLAQAREGWGELEEAADGYRRIDLLYPGEPVAAKAREALARLREGGVPVRAFTAPQRVERAERLLRDGPHRLARSEAERLSGMPLSRHLEQKLARVLARIARVEGRFEEAERLYGLAQGDPDLSPEELDDLADARATLGRVNAPTDPEEVLQRLRRVRQGERLREASTSRLFRLLRIAGRGDLGAEVNEILEELLRRDLPPGLRFRAAVLSAGPGSDEHIAALLEPARDHARYGVAASYHRARALERLGRVDEARAEYGRVIAEDDPSLPYYAVWASLRRAGLPAAPEAEPAAAVAPVEACSPLGTASPAWASMADRAAEAIVQATARVRQSALGGAPALSEEAPSEEAPPPGPGPLLVSEPEGEVLPPVPLAHPEAVAPAGASEEAAPASPSRTPSEAVPSAPVAADDGAAEEPALASLAIPSPRPPSLAQVRGLLHELARTHGEAYPFFGRALALVELGEVLAAADEVHEAYTAWREATGRGPSRAGLEAVLRGGTAPRRPVAHDTWVARRRFPREAQDKLARAAWGLGEAGLAIHLVGTEVTGPRPRAFRAEVEAAAAHWDVDPDLLHAVMRVESVYNPRIISYAGAIGLMQIMPRTGRHIADAVGDDRFTVDALLDPALNVDYAAWYLRSLLDRWDGRLPLAIASYNGGPHNVRRWMRDYSPRMPVDAFLEHIPFSQTHRYVRRVLTHYAAYRAQRGQPLPEQELTLPEPVADPIAF